jgi:hypothetical protein
MSFFPVDEGSVMSKFIKPIIAAAFICIGLAWVHADDVPRGPVVVKIEDDKTTVADVVSTAPVDPVQRIRINPQQLLNITLQGEQGQTLHLSHFPGFNIDGQFTMPQMGQGRYETVNAKLSKGANGKDRIGFMSVYILNDFRITQTVELTPTKAAGPGQKRLLDSALIRYTIENKSTKDHKFGMRIFMDTFIVDNDGCLFAAPTMPGKVLDGIELKDKTMPDYLQLLQKPDLKNPGYVAHMTMNLTNPVDRPNRVILTNLGAANFQNWEIPARMAGGDSAMGVYWDPRELKAGGKRELAYAYGKGIAIAPESEGHFNLVLGGSFEPGKVFTISAYVQDPAAGQSLTLDLPPGMERLEGKEIQPVAQGSEDHPESMILWKARVLKTGRYPLRVRSNTGVTQTKIITVSAAKP